MIILTWKWTKNLGIKFQFIWLNHPQSGPKPPSSRQGPARQLFFCAAFTLYYAENDRSQTKTAKKTDLIDEFTLKTHRNPLKVSFLYLFYRKVRKNNNI